MKQEKVNTALVRFIFRAQQIEFDNLSVEFFDKADLMDTPLEKNQSAGKARAYKDAARQMFVLSSLFED